MVFYVDVILDILENMNRLRIALIQTNPLVGDLQKNAKRIIYHIKALAGQGVQIAIFPELAICGYPPEDLLLKPHFIRKNKTYLNRIANACRGITAVIGYPHSVSGRLYNSAAIINNQKIIYTYHKIHLPNYSVFDEKRYFTPGNQYALIKNSGVTWSVNVCEDIWQSNRPNITRQQLNHSQLIINISASPYHYGKLHQREFILKQQARKHHTAIAYCNLCGGQDQLVFDGGSLIINEKGKIIARAKQFSEDTICADLSFPSGLKLPCQNNRVKIITLNSLKTGRAKPASPRLIPPLKPMPEIYEALTLGIRDYVSKNNFKKAILGLSGGIDSALTALLAVDALGKENVIGLSMPSSFTSSSALKNKQLLAKNLGIKLITVPITGLFHNYLKILQSHLGRKKWDATEENLQARIRGNILMVFSNKFNYLVLTTGNKSETSVGYTTLYGDMAGGLAVLQDVPKQLVYKLTRYANKKSGNKPVPANVFSRPPSAELRRNQKDTDSIPPYDILDPIIKAYVEEDRSLLEIVQSGVPRAVARKIVNLIDSNEYKRRQSPPGIKITTKAFGKDRRMPITCHIPDAIK